MQIMKVLKYLAIAATVLIVITFAKHIPFISLYEKFSMWLFPMNENRNGELFKIVLSILGALGILFSLYVSLRRAKAMEKGVIRQKEAINIQSEQIKISRKAQTDERFKNAVEHLGSEKEPVILGGIAALHQIAKENIEEYSEIVFNILCSYIRSSAKLNKKKANSINYTVIQTIINNLFKNSDCAEYPYLNLNADLRHSNLLSVDFENMDLSGANLSFCYLPDMLNINLQNSILSKAIFSLAKIENVNFLGAELHQTIFHASTIKNCDMSRNTTFLSTVFVDSVIKEVSFNGNKIVEIKFIASDILDSTFVRSEIVSCSFVGTLLNNIDLSELRLFGTNDFRAAGLYNVQVDTVITATKFNGCRNSGSFRYFLKDRLGEFIGKKANLSGIQLNGSTLHDCDTSELTQKDNDEILNLYKEYEDIKIYE